MREREEVEMTVEEPDANAMLATAIRYAVDEAVAGKWQGYRHAELAGRLRTLEIDVREQGKRVENFGQQSGSCIAVVAGRLDEIDVQIRQIQNYDEGRIAELDHDLAGVLKQVNDIGGRLHDLDGTVRRLGDRVWVVEHLDRIPSTLVGRLRWLILGR